jgi:RND family efflux transporter MFP subunit
MGNFPTADALAVGEAVVLVRLVKAGEFMKRQMIGLLGVAIACSGCNQTKETPVAAAAPTPAPTVSRPVAAAAPTFVASGPVVVENQVDVEALREGVVESIAAQPGTHVHRGQVLAKLDDRQISADLAAAAARSRAIEANIENWKAEEKSLQADYDRAEKLYQAQVIPKEQLDHAKYKQEADEFEIKRETETLANAKEVEKSLELERSKTIITAPFDGIVARRYVRDGQKVAVGDRLFWVTAMGPLEVKFTLPERYLSQIQVGQELSLTSEDISPPAQFSAKIAEVSPVVDPSSGTIEILARFEGATPALRPGMLVNVSLPEHP